MAERCDIDNVRVARIHDDCTDLPRIGKTDMLPRMSAVVGTIHPIAVRDVRTHVGLTSADVDDPRVTRSDRDRPDGRNVLVIEYRFPCAPRIVALPNAAVNRAEIEMVWFPGNARDRKCAAP